MWSAVDGSEKRGRGVWKDHLYEVGGFEAEHMMGEIESVRVSEGYGVNREAEGNGCVGVAVLGMSVRMGILEQRSLVESEGNSSNDGTRDQCKQ